MCWYLWVLIGSFPQQAQSQIAPELNMQALLQLKSTSARSFVTQVRDFLRFESLVGKEFLWRESRRAVLSSFLRGLTLGKNFSGLTIKRSTNLHIMYKWQWRLKHLIFFRNMPWSWIGFYLWWWWWWWWWWNVRMIVVCDFCRCDIFRVVAVHIRVGLMGPHVSDDPRAPHTK